MKFSDLTPTQQADYKWGYVSLYGFEWECRWKFYSEDTIEFYSDFGDWTCQYTHYKSLTTVGE